MSESVFCNSPLLTQVSSIVFGADGTLFATNFGNLDSNVIKITSSGSNASILTTFGGSSGFNNTCITYYNNYLYLTAINSGSVYKVDPVTGTYIIFSTILSSNTIFGITYYQNYFYVVAYTTYNAFLGVYKINVNDGTNTLFITATSQLQSILNVCSPYIAFDNNGNCYITNTLSQVLKFDNNGDLINATFINNVRLKNILFYNNNLYFTSTTNQINQYDLNGNLITNNFASGGYSYIGGGMAFDSTGNFYVSNETNGGGAGNVTINIIVTPPYPCFKEDTKILTDKGYKYIQDLRKGDLVKTLLHDYKAINNIGKKEIYHHALQKRIKDQLYKCSQSEYSEIFEPLIITGCHSILVNDFVSEEQKQKVIEVNGNTYVTDCKYRLPACADLRASVYENQGTYTIYHLALENDDYYMNYGIYANGLLVETCSKRYLKELSNMTLIE